MTLSAFHPAVSAWFRATLGEPTVPQTDAWRALGRGEHVLVAAPTGSGKTLAAFLVAIDALVREGIARGGSLPDEARVLYVSPLKALSHDIQKNLSEPLTGVARVLAAAGIDAPEVRTWVRTGDTDPRSRAQAVKRPPHIVVTTPESLYLLLTSDGGRRILRTVQSVVVDEIHALVRDKRGSHLALSLERLEALVREHGGGLQRIGLSATQRPIEDVARFLVGAPHEACTIVDTGHRRALDLALLMPSSPLSAAMSNEVWDELYERIVGLVEAHATTLVFVNTRRTCERVARRLSERLGEDVVGAHHGSLSRERRLDAEQRLKAGALKVLVATASLELGIDIGDVDLVCQLGSPRSIATFLQRVGRSGHSIHGTPKGRLVPLTRDDLVECTALLAALTRGELDRLRIPLAPLDVLAQQLVATVCALPEGEAASEDALFTLMTRAMPFHALARADFDAVLRMLADGFSTRRGRRGALIHHDAVGKRVRGRRGARLSALMSGGAIPDSFDYQVLLEPENLPVGTVHEDFAIESMAGEVFQLGNASYRIKKAEPGVLRVEDARGQSPSIPFWVAEAPGRTDELSEAVSRLRKDVVDTLRLGAEHARRALIDTLALSHEAAEQLVTYLGEAHAALGVMPSHDTIVAERFFDETDSMHVVLHTPRGTRVNRAFGLALRKRFCRSFNVELQAAATDDAIILSLGPMHSFALDDLFRFLRADGVRDVLIQALLPAPLFGVRFRWNASRALAVPRYRGGRKVAPRFQRMAADDLLAVTFPDQVACAENLEGEREIPDHPLVQQTIDDCLHEAMDIAGLTHLLGAIERGAVRCIARDLREPSPLAHEILNARPYAFLDDAPLEERRTQAVAARTRGARSHDALAVLDEQAIARVLAELTLDPRDADELHDLLLVHAGLVEHEALAFRSLFERLCATGRATCVQNDGARVWIARERVSLWRLALPAARLVPDCAQPTWVPDVAHTREQSLREIVRGRLEGVGPVTVSELAQVLGLAHADVEVALALLESEGFVLRGHYRAGAHDEEWCERRLLARIHRATLERLRSEIEPASPGHFMRYLLEHQHVQDGCRLAGVNGVEEVVAQLAGFGAGASAWESAILPARVLSYAAEQLDLLCFAGKVSWARAGKPSRREAQRDGPVHSTPMALYPRAALAMMREGPASELVLSPQAERVRSELTERGACFVSELARSTGYDQELVQEALGELVDAGLVSSDGFAGLRQLIGAQSARGASDAAGRYALLASASQSDDEAALELSARTLLARWGVVFRRLLERETNPPPWGRLLRVLWRLEARGEIRGGRFVTGFSGEQFATPEALTGLRRLRHHPLRHELVCISGSDPLNLTGIVTPGPRVPATASVRIALRDGVPAAALVGGKLQWLAPLEGEAHAQCEAALLSRPRAPGLAQRYAAFSS